MDDISDLGAMLVDISDLGAILDDISVVLGATLEDVYILEAIDLI